MLYKYVIGLDVSTHMGLAVVRVSPDIATEYHTEEIEGKGKGMARALQMVAILHDRLKLFGQPADFGFAVVEAAAHGAAGGPAHAILGELNAIMRFSLHLKGIPAFTVAPNTIKKFATGNGRAGKPEMIAAARVAYPGIDRLTDNEADALHLARFGLELVTPGSVQGPNARGLVKDWAGRNLKQLEQTGLFQ